MRDVTLSNSRINEKFLKLRMTSIAFFAHDRGDAAVRRRVQAFERSGCRVIGFAMRRSDAIDTSWDAYDLGRTHDAQYAQRVRAILQGAVKAANSRSLEHAEVIYARNLDMLVCAQLALGLARLARPIVYECLDIHRLMRRRDAVGASLRGLERLLLTRCSLVVVSSPAFIREHFDVHHSGRFRALLVENRMAEGDSLAPRPSPRQANPPLRIGWFGVLRCRRSLALLESVASRFPAHVRVMLRGYPDVALPDFYDRISQHKNINYGGRYRSPDDLDKVYDDVDLIWAGDFHDAGFNSKWLLPNRLYEGGYFGTPAIAPSESETGKWLRERGTGFTVDEPLEEHLPALIGRFVTSSSEIDALRSRLLSLPREVFIQPDREMRTVIERALAAFHRQQRNLSNGPAVDEALVDQ